MKSGIRSGLTTYKKGYISIGFLDIGAPVKSMTLFIYEINNAIFQIASLSLYFKKPASSVMQTLKSFSLI